MKTSIKNLFFLLPLMTGLAVIPASRVTAQTFTVLHSFTLTSSSFPYGNNDGANPKGRLSLSGNTLYGTAWQGGGSDDGTVFAVNTDGTGFTPLHNFTGCCPNSDGALPTAGLIASSNMLYGTATYGGSYTNGTLFAVHTDGTGFMVLHTFTGRHGDGARPGGLLLSGNTLYGTTASGGTSGGGTLFRVDTDGTGFTIMHSFGGTSPNGAYPGAPLILSGTTLYGTTTQGGGAGYGTVFKLNTDGTGFTNLHSFTSISGAFPGPFTNSDGASPSGGLVLSANTLYGTATSGGSGGNGTVFAVNTDGTGFITVHSFAATSPYGPGTNSDGSGPTALLLAGNTLYGTAGGGGTGGSGTVFTLNTNGAGFTTLHNFTATPAYPGPYTNSDGAGPEGLVLSGDTLYGTAAGGGSGTAGGNGSGGNGTVFSISLGCPALAFGPPRSFSVGTSCKYAVAIGDFNGDHKPDLAVGGALGVAVLLGDGTGVFGPPINYLTENAASFVVLGDLNGDGCTDIAAPIEAEDQVSVLLSHCDGTLAEASTNAVEDVPVSVALVRGFNPSGLPDLVVLNQYGGSEFFGSISLLHNDGQGRFLTANDIYDFNDLSKYPQTIASGDFDGDGITNEFAVATPGGMYFEPGTGTFYPYSALVHIFRGATEIDAKPVGTNPVSIAVADLNEDGHLDLAVVNQDENTVSILLGNGNGTFTNQTKFSVGHMPVSLAVGDFNGDGHIDLVVANGGTNAVSIILGDGRGGFGPETLLLGGGVSGAYPHPNSVAVADLNGDGRPDVVVADGNGNAAVFLNTCGTSVAAPELAIVQSGANVVLTWATNASGFSLQSTTNLVSPPVWTTVSPGPVVVNGQNTVTNPISGPQKFYRLIQ